MKTTQYLYDVEPHTWDYTLYPEAIEARRDAAVALLGQLRQEPVKDFDRIDAVMEAISFNQYLLDEMESDS